MSIAFGIDNISNNKGLFMTHSDFAHPYFGAFILLILSFAAFFATISIARFVSRRLAAKDRERLKLSIYECGPEANLQPNRISAHFYLFGLLFILFDIEIIFMFPWALDFRILGWFGMIEMAAFIGLLTVGFAYAWKKGALIWHSIK